MNEFTFSNDLINYNINKAHDQLESSQEIIEPRLSNLIKNDCNQPSFPKESIQNNIQNIQNDQKLPESILEFNNKENQENIHNYDSSQEIKKENFDKIEISFPQNININNPEGMTEGRKKLIFFMFLISNLFLNYDTGAIPSSLLEIIKEIKLDYKEQALLASLTYFGLSSVTIFVGLIFTKFPPSKICSFSLLINSLFCFVFSLSNKKKILFLSRFFMGVTSAFIVVYSPVWVNNYSPQNHMSRWMGILNSCAIIGVVLGYIIAGMIINFCKGFLSWRFSLQIQGFMEIFCFVFFFVQKNEHINIKMNNNNPNNNVNDMFFSAKNSCSVRKSNNNSFSVYDNNSNNINNLSNINNVNNINNNRKQEESPHNDKDPNSKKNNNTISQNYNTPSYRSYHGIESFELSIIRQYFNQARSVLMNPVFLYVSLGLCSIYFIVAGIQFWITAYLIQILHMKSLVVVVAFSVISVTAPIGGVLLGAYCADQYGGYKGKNSLKALKLCVLFGSIPFFFSFLLGFIFSPIYFLIILWFFLFFGACIIPVGTGIMISSVKPECQATSSSLSQLLFNIFGYFLSPILTGVIMDIFKNKRMGFIWGMRVLFFWVIFGFIFLLCAYYKDMKKYNKKLNKEERDLINDEEMKEDLEEFMRLEILRRMALNSK